jgi:hypothetical protein
MANHLNQFDSGLIRTQKLLPKLLLGVVAQAL